MNLAGTFAHTLLHSLWEGAAAALGLAVVLCVTRSPRVRYAAGCVALLALLGGFLVTFIQLTPEPTNHSQPSAAVYVTSPQAQLRQVAPMAPGGESQPTDYTTWIVQGWIAGVFLFYLRGMMGWLASRRLRLTGVCCAPEEWRDRMDRLQTQLRLSKRVTLLESSLAEVPVVVGYLRPVILMPVGFLTGMAASQVEAILLHELAHIRRYDALVNLLQVFVEGLLFYHPAVWWISGSMRAERENCCDDVVVSVTQNAHEYAKALEVLEQRRTSPAMAMAASGGSLLNRIHRLLGHRENTYSGLMPVLAMALLAVAGATAMTALQPRTQGRVILPPPPANKVVFPVRPVTPPLLVAQAAPPPTRVSPAETQALPDHRDAPADQQILMRPGVTVSIPENPTAYISVVGDVKIPGQFEIKAPITLIEALAKAGWATASAGPDLMLSVRGSVAQRINIWQLQQSLDPALNVLLTGGEVIVVPDAPKVWVTGHVQHPQAVPIRGPGGITLLQVLAYVDGLTPNYNKTAYVYRVGEGRRRYEIAVPLKDIMDRTAQDVRLLENDVLLIPDDEPGVHRENERQYYDTRPPSAPGETTK